MPFQSTVNQLQGFGVVGELFSEGPTRSRPYTLASLAAANNVMGRAFTLAAEGAGFARAGGTGAFAGLMVGPKEQAMQGTAVGGTLAPTLTLRNGEVAEMCDMGQVIIELPGAANVGDLLVYHTTTGVLDSIAPDASPAGPPANHAYVPNAFVAAYDVTSGLAVAQLTN